MKKEYFHIAKKTALPWSTYAQIKVGNFIETGNNNPFFNYFLEGVRQAQTINYPDGTSKNFSEMEFLFGLSSGNLRLDTKAIDVAKIGHDLAMHFCKYTRELIWEDVRRELFRDKPSRQKCLWLAEGEQNLQYWLSQLGDPDGLSVFKLEIEGVTHDASDEYLMKDNMAYEQARAMAISYWNGDISNSIKKEVLFEGRARVVEQIS